MSFTLANQLQLKLTIGEDGGGMEIPIDPNLYTKLSIIQNPKNLLGAVQLGIYDVLGLSQRTGAFLDGAKLTVSMGPANGVKPVRNHTFRIFSTKMKPTPKGMLIDISGVLDAPAYFRKVIDKAFPKMNASQVVQQVVGMGGLKAIVDPTFDKMTWLPDNKTLGQFARYVTDHAWAGNSSCMMLACTEKAGDWHIRLKDVNKAMGEGAIATFVNDRPSSGTTYFAMQHEVQSFSGFMNNLYGYGSETHQSMLKKDFDMFGDITAMFSGGGGLNMSKLMKGAVGIARNEFAPFDVGNVHDKFFKAKHQNSKLRATFSCNLSLLVGDQTDLSIFDPVDVRLMNMQTGDADVVYNGKYLVDTKTMYCKGEEYRELLVVTNQGGGQQDGSNVGG